MNDMGKQIRALRLKKNITQEKLAGRLLISPQAVSKWENGQTLPDITLLPGLSTQLGVSIDELFELTDETHLERIQNMLDDTAPLTREAADYARGFLEKKLEDRVRSPGRCPCWRSCTATRRRAPPGTGCWRSIRRNGWRICATGTAWFA